MDVKAQIIDRAQQEGFVAARVCRPDAVPEVMDRLRAFLDKGSHGEMQWLAERVRHLQSLTSELYRQRIQQLNGPR